MPEDVEVDSAKLHEAIHEELERDGGSFLKQTALTTALLAACAAIASPEAGGTVNEALVLKTEAARLQTEASDQWAFCQAKGIKAAVADASRTAWLAAGHESPASCAETGARYVREQDEITKTAQEKQRERDAKDRETDALLHRHHGYAGAVALFQVSIALGAVAALARHRTVWFGSGLIGVARLGLAPFTWLD
jgi:hypothetical protein